jgi:hypothetical protein
MRKSARARSSITILCPTSDRAHALRHELDKLGALSKRQGRRIRTNVSMALVHKARTRAASRRSGTARRRRAHHRRTR